ncbi:hypothetical protein KCP73_01875 [Salmonella enterica subsp. enterica]|nr:hypothetical protein KCP73_01875 [Salmonella enterica subsp. enterica]
MSSFIKNTVLKMYHNPRRFSGHCAFNTSIPVGSVRRLIASIRYPFCSSTTSTPGAGLLLVLLTNMCRYRYCRQRRGATAGLQQEMLSR